MCYLVGCLRGGTFVRDCGPHCSRLLLLPLLLQATQHSECRFSISVRRATTSGGHMVAVAGLAVAHQDAVRLLTVPGSVGEFPGAPRLLSWGVASGTVAAFQKGG